MKKLDRKELARRVARDIPDGAYVNLGIGLPTLIADYLPPDREIVLHSENGLLGMGPQPAPEDADADLINAGKQPVTAVTGASFFHHANSFAMIRGGHIDICVLGAFQVSTRGDLANWHTGDKDAIPAVGGAMDLAVGAKQVFVMMEHLTKIGPEQDRRALHLSVDRRCLRFAHLYRPCGHRCAARGPGCRRQGRRFDARGTRAPDQRAADKRVTAASRAAQNALMIPPQPLAAAINRFGLARGRSMNLASRYIVGVVVGGESLRSEARDLRSLLAPEPIEKERRVDAQNSCGLQQVLGREPLHAAFITVKLSR